MELERIFKYKAIFLHVSVDTDAEEWRRMLANENDWFGVHIIIDQGQVRNMDRNYKVIGYPKYFLIDQVDKIVSAKAPRPSSSRAKDEIASLVSNGARSQ